MIKKKFEKTLIVWHKKNLRNFLWRTTDDPYTILLTEIMLQRTRAEKVSEIYEIFFKQYPNIISLSNASEKELSKLIAPLGLKKRCPYMIELSKIIRDNYNSRVPNTIDELLSLKGVGFYTANAVMCFAYEECLAVVDWNIARVLKRIWDIDITDSPHSNKKVMAFAQELIPEDKAKEYNWALLDFAALVCKPQKPDCFNCPMQNFCAHHQNRYATQNKTR